MTEILRAIAALMLFISMLASASNGPTQAKPIVDAAHVLGIDEIKRLTTMIKNARKESGACIYVLTIETTSGEPIESYSRRSRSQWTLENNCSKKHLLMVFAMKDKNVRIDVGEQLHISDEKIKYTIDTFVVPEFIKGNYEQGIQAALNNLLTTGATPSSSASSNALPSWYFSRANGKYLLNGESDLECIPAETTPLETIDELQRNRMSFTTNDTTDDATGKVIMTMITIKGLNQTLIFWRKKADCERVVLARREASEAKRNRYK